MNNSIDNMNRIQEQLQTVDKLKNRIELCENHCLTNTNSLLKINSPPTEGVVGESVSVSQDKTDEPRTSEPMNALAN